MKKTIKTDPTKLNVELIHDFYPLKDDEEVYVTVEHLRNGDIMNFTDFATHEIDYPKLFLRKVKSVHGIQIADAEGNVIDATKEHIVNISDQDFLTIVMSTCAHLIEGSSLTEDEAKN